MVDRNFNDVYRKLAELPLRRYAEVLRNKAQDLTTMLGAPAYFDQYPSKRVPWIFSRTYGPIGLTATRNLTISPIVSGTLTAESVGGTIVDATQTWAVDEFAGFQIVFPSVRPDVKYVILSNTATTITVGEDLGGLGIGTPFEIFANGFDQLAPVVNPNEYLLPREGTIKTGREAAFIWCSSNAFAYLSWTYTQQPTFTSDQPFFVSPSVPSTPLPPGDLFDPVLSMNGGGVVIPNIANANFTSPRVCFELALYDKKRGRYLTDGKLPAEAFVGGAFANKLTPKQTRWNVDTEIEPRVTVTEVNMGPVLNQAQAYQYARVAVYVNLAFVGYNILEEKFNETDTFSAVKSRG